jgi:beta-mannosidase
MTSELSGADPVGRGGADLLAGAGWRCLSVPAGTGEGPEDLDLTDSQWMDAAVPGTVAGALRRVGATEPTLERLDGQDWWFRCRFTGPVPVPDDAAAGGPDGWILSLDGLATLADVWLNGVHVLRSESMFAAHRVPVGALAHDNELCLRFAALAPVLAVRRPRPRWKARGVSNQNLRWLRTTLLGRQSGWSSIPAPVGPWRPVRLTPELSVALATRRVRAGCATDVDGTAVGTVTVELDVHGPGLSEVGSPVTATVEVAGRTAPLTVTRSDDGVRVSGEVTVDRVERWWPHTHGGQPLYPVRAVVAGVAFELGEVGFRTVVADRADGSFRLVVNDVPVFCRGACWYPVDPVSLQNTDAELVATIDLVRAGGMNLLRIPGGTVYEDDRFFDACDRAGVLVWQEAMLGPVDPPDDEGFVAAVVAEVSGVLDRTACHPSLAVLCGGQELEEQPAMFGLPRERWTSPVVHAALPELVAREAPGLAYVTSSPTGGDLPFFTDSGISHYFGVGVYLFPLEDLRRSSPRFVTEGLAFATPPERVTMDEAFGGDLAAHHESDWKRAVHRDAGSWFDLEDVRDHYVTSLFGVDVAALWRTDPDRALDLGRAAVTEVVAAAFAEWRRPGSPCDGVVAMALRDLRAGPGWGLIDSSGRPKAPWFAFARGAAPVAVMMTDERVNGLAVHMVNDTAVAVVGTLELGLHTAAHRVESASCPVDVPARGGTVVRADRLFDGFRDLSYAYCFGARTYELVTADLVGPTGDVVARAAFQPGGPARALDPDVGRQATVGPVDGDAWLLRVSSRRFAQYVQVDVPGFAADDSWFHLPPGGERLVTLRPEPGHAPAPKGRVRALNSAVAATVSS